MPMCVPWQNLQTQDRMFVFCSSVIVLHTKLWSEYNCCKSFMTWQLIIRHLLLICMTSHTHTHTHTQRVYVFPVRHSAIFSCLRKTSDKFTAVRVLVTTNVPRLGDSDLKDFRVKNICCGLVGWYQRFVRTRFLHLQRQYAPQQRWHHKCHSPHGCNNTTFYMTMLMCLCAYHMHSTWLSASRVPLIFMVDTWLRCTVFHAPAALSHGNSP
jgi:hypothetical protein